MSDNPLISASELLGVLRDRPVSTPPPILLDVRWTLAGSDRAAYLDGHLPGAFFVDLDNDLAGAPGDGGRHPLPDPTDLEAVWRSVGMTDRDSVVVYDGGIGMAAARAWWLLRWSGFDAVRVLDGGLPAWTGAGQPTASGAESPPAVGTVTVNPGSMPVVTADEAAELASSTDGLLVDARAAARFRGEIEPIDPVAGHIPGSVNLPIAELLTAADGTFRSPGELAAAFRGVGVGVGIGPGDRDAAAGGRPGTVAASCGSGVTACQLILAAEIAGLRLSLFPGSYSQWCAIGRPVAVGAT